VVLARRQDSILEMNGLSPIRYAWPFGQERNGAETKNFLAITGPIEEGTSR
jgi:hypothetical protein